MTRAASKPARFDAAEQRRRGMLARVHIRKKELMLDGDAYRDVLFGATGKDSAGDCDERELRLVLDRMDAMDGRQSRPSGRNRARPADHKMAGKARALWISLYHLGAIRNPSEPALEGFARRQLGCERLQWADQRLGYRLIEALKAIAERHGWDQSTEGVAVAAVPTVLRRRLVDRITGKLRAIGIVPDDWTVAQTAWRLAGIEFNPTLASASELDVLAAALGDKLRTARATMGDKLCND
ncbi:MAG: phage protein GemA/Gp16 family protein [Pseudomonadota bacterium]